MANWLCLMYCDFLLRINAAPELVWLLESVSMESLVGVEHWTLLAHSSSLHRLSTTDLTGITST